jgi:hypothetical protein
MSAAPVALRNDFSPGGGNVTLSDSVNIRTNGEVVGLKIAASSGTVVLVCEDGSVVTYKVAEAGDIPPYRVVRVNNTSTTVAAADITYFFLTRT